MKRIDDASYGRRCRGHGRLRGSHGRLGRWARGAGAPSFASRSVDARTFEALRWAILRSVAALLAALSAGFPSSGCSGANPAGAGAGTIETSAPSTLDGRASDATDAPVVEWHEVRLGDASAGFLRVTRETLADGALRTTNDLRLAFQRDGTATELEAAETIEEDDHGAVRSFRLVQKLARRAMTIEGRVDGARLLVTTTVDGQAPRHAELPFDPAAIGPACQERRSAEELRREGDRAEAVVFLASVAKCVRQVQSAGPLEVVTDLPDGPRELRRVVSQSEGVPPVTQWLDTGGTTWKSATSLMGQEMVTLRRAAATEETMARFLEDARKTAPDIFRSTTLPVSRVVPPDAVQVKYRLRRSGDASGESDIDVARRYQTSARETDGSLLVTVRRAVPESACPRRERTEADAEDPDLAGSAWVQIDDPAIVAAAREAVGDATDAWRAAVAIEAWVRRTIEEKNLETSFASASEVLATRAGDCTEHAVLFAAIARAAGIPARVVAGVVHRRRAFVGHMWNEVRCGEEWFALDATMGRGEVGADHIAFATSSLGDAATGDLYLELARWLGATEIDVESIVLQEER